MGTHSMFLCRNKKNIVTFRMKKVPCLELCISISVPLNSISSALSPNRVIRGQPPNVAISGVSIKSY